MNVVLTITALPRSFRVASRLGKFRCCGLVSQTFSTSCVNHKSEKLWLEMQHRDPYVKAAGKLNYRARSAFKLLEIDEKFEIFHTGQIVLDCGAAPGSWSQVAVQRLRGPPKFKAYTVRQLLNFHKSPIGFHESEIADFQSSPEAGLVVGLDLSAILPLTGAAFLPNADIFDPATQDRVTRVLDQHRKLIALSQAGEEGASGANNDIFVESDGAIVPPPRCVDVVMSDMAPNCTGQAEHDHHNICRLARGAYGLAAVFLKGGGSFIFKLFDGKSRNGIVEQLKTRFASVRIFVPNTTRSHSAEIFIIAKGFKPPVD